jgi:hypothetical protein
MVFDKFFDQSGSQCLALFELFVALKSLLSSVADLDPFEPDPDPAFQFDTDPDADPAFQFEPDPTVYGSGSLPFQRGYVPKTVRYILYIFT